MSDKKVGAGFGVIILNDEDKVLMGRRHDDPEKADSMLKGEGTWTLPGGKMDFGEGVEEGAAREVKEETSLDIKLDDLDVISVSNDMVDTAHFVTIGLLARDYTGEVKIMEPDEITKWQWFEMDSLPENIFFPSARILENYRKGEFYIKRN